MLSEPILVARLEQEERLMQAIAWTKDYIENGDWSVNTGELEYLQNQLKELEQCLNPCPRYNREPLYL